MMRHTRGSILLTTPRKRVLEELAAKGPLTLPEIPRNWPFTRGMLEDMVKELVGVGLVEAAPSRRVPGSVAYSLTRTGWTHLAPEMVSGGPALLAG